MKRSSRANDRKWLYFKTILEKMRQRDVPVAALLLRRRACSWENLEFFVMIIRTGRKRTDDEEEIDDDEEKGERKMKKNKKRDCRFRNKWGGGGENENIPIAWREVRAAVKKRCGGKNRKD